MTTVVKRPALRYHGGKWNLAPQIISRFPPHNIYVEPFGGAASVLLRKSRSYAEVYNDLDAEVVNVFKQLRDNGDELNRVLHLTPFSRAEYALANEKSPDLLEQARRTVIKSFRGFGSDAIKRPSGFRANSNRSGTTPAHDWRNYADTLAFLVDRLRGVVIESRDFEKVIKAHDSEETALVVRGKLNIFKILSGDFRDEYEKLYPSLEASLKFFDSQKAKHGNNWSTLEEDRPAIGESK